MFNFNDNIGSETLYKEYKEFSFHPCGLLLSNEDALSLLESNEWIFNKDVIKCIKLMFELYLPRYTCAYLSSNLKEESYLYFGIDDIGNITGIPFQGELNIDMFIDDIHKILTQNIDFDGNIMHYINIEFHKINFTNHIENTNIHLNEYYKHIKLYNDYTEKFTKKKLVWTSLLKRYNRKLTEITNNIDTRIELINFIEYRDYGNPLIKLLKTDFKLKPSPIGHVHVYKLDKNSIYYWLTMFKDTMLRFIKKIKPKFDYKFPCIYFPINILFLSSPMIPFWFKNNQNMNLYLITITFKNKQSLFIKYKNNFNKWLQCKRTLINDDPCCINL